MATRRSEAGFTRAAVVSVTAFSAVTMLCACVSHVSGAPRPATQSSEATPNPSTARGPVPDFGQFTARDPESFFVPLRGGPSYQFVTPAGFSCELNFGGMRCSGVFSDTGRPIADGCSAVGPTNNGRATPPYTYTFTRREGKCAVSEGKQLLDVGEKVVAPLQVGVFTCAVDLDRRLMCLDDRENHGFVLQPSDSWTF